MKITLELPDNTQAGFINYLCGDGFQQVLVSKMIGKKDLENGYKDCSKYEVADERQ